MIWMRSLLFNLCFFSWSLLASLLFAPIFLLSPRLTQRVGEPWGKGVLLLARLICGIRYEIRGLQYMQDAPVMYACKHQSAWDTIIFLVLFKRPAYVLKQQLLRIPGWGWYLWRMRMIAIDRSGKASSIKHMVKQSKAALAECRPIIIFPEGTRTAPGAASQYHPGVAALYSQLKVPVIPVALNSGKYWGRNAFTKHAGTIIIEFLPPMESVLPAREFVKTLQEKIEIASALLLQDFMRK